MSRFLDNIFKELEATKHKQYEKWSTLLKYFTITYAVYFVLMDGLHFFRSRNFELTESCLFLGALLISYGLSFVVKHNSIIFIPSLACFFISLFSFEPSQAEPIPTWFSFQALGLFMAVMLSDFKGNLIYATLTALFPFFAYTLHTDTSIIDIILKQNLMYFGIISACFYSYYLSVRTRAEQKENESARLIKKASDLGTWQWNLKTNEVQYDERWLGILGYKLGELPEDLTTWQTLTHPDDGVKATEQFQSYLLGESDEYEVKFRMKHKNGRWVPIISKGKIVSRDEDGKPHFFSGTHFDLSKIESLEEQNEKLSSLFEIVQELSNLGGWEVDIKTMQTQWTDQVYKIHGVEVGKKHHTENAIKFYAPHERERITRYVQECIEQGKGFDDKFEFIDAQGNHKWVRSIGEAVIGEDGEITKIRGVFQDITEQIEREDIIHQSERLASLGKLARGIGHEINNPLAIIKGFVYLLQKNLENSPESYHDHFAKINQGVERIKNIVQGIKDFTEGDNSSHEILDLSEVVGSSISLLEDIHGAKSIKIKNEFNVENRIFIKANRGKIQQLIQNLVSNAVDAVEGVEDPKVIISSIENESFITVQIQDNGCGIDHDIRSKIFDPFFTTKKLNTGTGNGLTICHDIVKTHHGQISVESEKGKGSIFSFTLPLEQQELLKAS